MAVWVGLVRDACSAAVFAELLDRGAVAGVRVDDKPSWAGVDGPLASDDPAGSLVTVGQPAIGAAVIDVGNSGPGYPDPLSLALIERRDAVPVTLRDGDGPLGTSIVAIVPDAGYPDLAAAVAATVAPWLSRAPRAPLPAAAKQAEPVVPVEAWTRIDWSAAADEVVSAVRAFGPPQRGAWTRLDGVRVVVDVATRRPGRRPPGPPGLVLAVAADAVDVLAGDGVVRVSGLRDLVGRVHPGEIRAGQLLGRDLAAEVDGLLQRVRDLERLVRYLIVEGKAPC